MMPTIEHVLFIPAALLAGGVLGFWLGVRKAESEIQRRERERRK